LPAATARFPLPAPTLCRQKAPPALSDSRRANQYGGNKRFHSTFHAVISLFVDSKVTIATKEKEYKRQNAEMEKAAKAAFEITSRYLLLRSST
jgi:RecB family exonuclease